MGNKIKKSKFARTQPAAVKKTDIKTETPIKKESEMPKEKTDIARDAIEKPIEKPIENIPETKEMNNEDFRNALADSLKKEDRAVLEVNPNTVANNPILKPKIENDYTSAGIKNKIEEGASEVNTEETSSADTSSENPDISSDTTKGSTPKPNPTKPVDDFEAEPPAPDDAKTQTTSTDPEKKIVNPMGLPTGSANDMVTWGFGIANYGIDKFGGFITDVPIKTEFFRIKGVVPDIIEHNQKNLEKLKFNAQDIELIRKPLVDVLEEKGIEGFSKMEQLAFAIAAVIASKIKIFIEIRVQNKKLVEDISIRINRSEEGIRAEMKARMEEMEARMREEFKKDSNRTPEKPGEKFDEAEIVSIEKNK